jgi:hypothetical protein
MPGGLAKPSAPGRAVRSIFDVPSGQFLVHWEYPNGTSGVIYKLQVNATSEEGTLAAQGITAKVGRNLPKNQGEVKFEDVPGRYRLEFEKPSDPDDEYVVTAYNCEPKNTKTGKS